MCGLQSQLTGNAILNYVATYDEFGWVTMIFKNLFVFLYIHNCFILLKSIRLLSTYNSVVLIYGHKDHARCSKRHLTRVFLRHPVGAITFAKDVF